MTGHGGGRKASIRTAGAVIAIFALLIPWASPTALEGQSIRGRLLDLGSEMPLRAGLVTLRAADKSPIAAVFTDEGGHWAFDLPGPGVYYVEASRLDYAPWVAGPLTVTEEDDLNSVFHLRRRPVELDPIEVSVTATRLHLERAGFYARQRSNFGYFMDPKEIQRRQVDRVTDLLTRIPGVRLVSMSTGSVGGRYVTLRGSNLSDGGICRPRVFVDGLLFAAGDSRPRPLVENDETEMQEDLLERIDQGLSLDDIGPARDIAAIEVYRTASQVPVQFGGTSVETLCGVIVFWTRRGTPMGPGR